MFSDFWLKIIQKIYQSFEFQKSFKRYSCEKFLKDILKKCSYFYHSFANASGFLNQSFKKLFFSLWGIVQSISITLKLSRDYFHVTVVKILWTPFLSKSIWFCSWKYFKHLNRRPLSRTINYFIVFSKMRIWTPSPSSYTPLVRIWPKMRNGI